MFPRKSSLPSLRKEVVTCTMTTWGDPNYPSNNPLGIKSLPLLNICLCVCDSSEWIVSRQLNRAQTHGWIMKGMIPPLAQKNGCPMSQTHCLHRLFFLFIFSLVCFLFLFFFYFHLNWISEMYCNGISENCTFWSLIIPKNQFLILYNFGYFK